MLVWRRIRRSGVRLTMQVFAERHSAKLYSTNECLMKRWRLSSCCMVSANWESAKRHEIDAKWFDESAKTQFIALGIGETEFGETGLDDSKKLHSLKRHSTNRHSAKWDSAMRWCCIHAETRCGETAFSETVFGETWDCPSFYSLCLKQPCMVKVVMFWRFVSLYTLSNSMFGESSHHNMAKLWLIALRR